MCKKSVEERISEIFYEIDNPTTEHGKLIKIIEKIFGYICNTLSKTTVKRIYFTQRTTYDYDGDQTYWYTIDFYVSITDIGYQDQNSLLQIKVTDKIGFPVTIRDFYHDQIEVFNMDALEDTIIDFLNRDETKMRLDAYRNLAGIKE